MYEQQQSYLSLQKKYLNQNKATTGHPVYLKIVLDSIVFNYFGNQCEKYETTQQQLRLEQLQTRLVKQRYQTYFVLVRVNGQDQFSKRISNADNVMIFQESDFFLWKARPVNHFQMWIFAGKAEKKQNQQNQNENQKKKQFNKTKDCLQFGYCQFQLSKMMKMTRIEHCIEADVGLLERMQVQQKIATSYMRIFAAEKDLGTLQITCVKAELTRDTDTFGQMDPFFMIRVYYSQGKSVQFRTQTLKNKGKSPEWQKIKITIPIPHVQMNAQMIIFDEDRFANEIVGSTDVISLFGEGFLKSKLTKQFQIDYLAKKAGKITITANFKLNLN